MAPVASAEPPRAANVIALLFTAQRQNSHGDPVAGERLFLQGCERCHAAMSAGRSAGPPLEVRKRSISPILLGRSCDHGTGRSEAMGAAGIEPSTFAGAELPDIMAYVLAAGRDPRAEAAPVVLGVAERGKQLFADKGCARGHAVGGKSTARGPSLGPHTPRATVPSSRSDVDHGPAVRTYIRPRHQSTPAHRTGCRTSPRSPASFYFDPSQGNRQRGQRLVESNGCLRCHSIFGKGGELAPDLARSNVVSTQAGQLSAMWNDGRQMENVARLQGIELPTLTGQQLADITRFLAGLGAGAPVGPPRSK